ncbi:chaperone, putative [Plasmodium reichenowi]|uniref:Chaperone, putative n=1 Tax=Plasmodium reichenowi TaxID=5854 RepID=A0A060RXP9_PLARE|nr:chaperone, putative [Plasmodium reichenowi]
MKKIKYLSILWKHKKINICNHKNYYTYNLAQNFFHSNKNNIDSNNYNGNIRSNKNKVKHFKCPKCNNNISTHTVSFNCEVCKALFNIDIFRNFNIFELFNIEVKYDIDKSHLKKKFNEIQNIYHPDKNAQNVEVDEINEVSSYFNNAYKTLLNDVERALYLLKMEYNYMISEDECMDDDEFLSEIIKINVEISKPDANIELLTREYKQKYEDYSKEIKLHFKEKNFNNILNVLKKLKFINRVLERLQNI